MAEDLYGLLGVPRTADADAVKKAYRKLARDLHPDKNPGNKQAESRFKLVNHAFDVIGDPKKRAIYDEFGEEGLREGFDPERVRAYKRWSSQQGARSGGFGGQGGFGSGGSVNLEDLFGGNTDGGIADLFGRARRSRGPMKGSDSESEITIDFAAALRGTTLELSVRGNNVTVRIPAGAEEGSRVRIAGQGSPSPNGGPSGDLLLVIHVLPHRFFRREGDDLHVDLPVTVAEAYSGAKVKVPTVDGAVSLKVPPKTQTGTVMRLRGKGVARKGRTAGDLYVHFLVQIPTKDTPELAKLVEAMAKFQEEDVRADLAL